MKMSNTKYFALAALAVGMFGSAHATSSWNFSSGTTATTTLLSGSADPTLASFSGVYATNNTANSGFATTSTTWTTGTAANLLYWSGSGVGMASDGNVSPNHAIDNSGNTEAILFNFASSVVLSSVGIGWKSGDADISLFRYIGGSAPTLSTTSATTMAGWQLVGNYADLAVDTSAPYTAVNSGNLGSSWWLLSAYNGNYGGASTSTTDPITGLQQGNDFFKVFGVTGRACTSTAAGVCSPSKVPEPTSLALFGAGLLGLIGARRRRNASAV